MNTNFVSFVFQVIQFVLYFVVGATLAIYALRAASHKSARSTRLFEWDESGETPRWQPLGLAVSTGQYGWTWGKGFGPRWTRENEEGERVPIMVVAFSQFIRTDAHTEDRFLGRDQKWFLLVKPQFAVPTGLKVTYGLLGLILVGFAFWQVSPRIFTSVPTIVAATARPASTGVVVSTQTIVEATRQAQITPTPTRMPPPLVTLGPCTNCTPTPENTPVLLWPVSLTPTPITTPSAPSSSNSPIGGLLLIAFGFILGAVVATIFWQRQKNK